MRKAGRLVCDLCGAQCVHELQAEKEGWDWFTGWLPAIFHVCSPCRTTRPTVVAQMRVKAMTPPHPNDKAAQVRTLKKRLRREIDYAPNKAVLDAMARAALEAAKARIEELEAEVARLTALHAPLERQPMPDGRVSKQQDQPEELGRNES